MATTPGGATAMPTHGPLYIVAGTRRRHNTCTRSRHRNRHPAMLGIMLNIFVSARHNNELGVLNIQGGRRAGLHLYCPRGAVLLRHCGSGWRRVDATTQPVAIKDTDLHKIHSITDFSIQASFSLLPLLINTDGPIDA
jgi:hypothetical protein